MRPEDSWWNRPGHEASRGTEAALSWRGGKASHWSHKPEKAGSIPAAITRRDIAMFETAEIRPICRASDNALEVIVERCSVCRCQSGGTREQLQNAGWRVATFDWFTRVLCPVCAGQPWDAKDLY